jgi:Cysteine-rich CPXCG
MLTGCRRWHPTGMPSGFQCASCGEWNETVVDASAGGKQTYVEDCQVCCKPNVLRISWDNSGGEYAIAAELE